MNDQLTAHAPNAPVDDHALDQLFRTARTYSAWQDKPVPEATLLAMMELVKMGPTSANCCPARFVFVSTPEAKKRLEPLLDEGNRAKTMKAPVTAIVAYDMEFYELMPKLFPHTDAKSWFAGKPDHIRTTAFRNGSLQGAYLIMAARALGLDTGPMSGFNNEGVDKEFLAGTTYKSNFLVNIGYGDSASLHPRSPRLAFDEFCKVV